MLCQISSLKSSPRNREGEDYEGRHGVASETYKDARSPLAQKKQEEMDTLQSELQTNRHQ